MCWGSRWWIPVHARCPGDAGHTRADKPDGNESAPSWGGGGACRQRGTLPPQEILHHPGSNVTLWYELPPIPPDSRGGLPAPPTVLGVHRYCPTRTSSHASATSCSPGRS